MGPKIRCVTQGGCGHRDVFRSLTPAVEQQHRKEMPGTGFTVFSNEL